MTAKRTALRPRIITRTVTAMRELAADIDAAILAPDMIASQLRLMATALDDGADGRETQEKRRRRK